MAKRNYRAGDMVYYQGQFGNGASSLYKIVTRLPTDRDAQVRYRIKNPAELFERVALEEQLSSARD